jgi:hypothetical protein
MFMSRGGKSRMVFSRTKGAHESISRHEGSQRSKHGSVRQEARESYPARIVDVRHRTVPWIAEQDLNVRINYWYKRLSGN